MEIFYKGVRDKDYFKTITYVTVVVVAFSCCPDGVKTFAISVSNGSYRDFLFINGIFHSSLLRNSRTILEIYAYVKNFPD